MPLIKIVTTESHNIGEYGDRLNIIGREITDWEEVSAEDLALLKKYRWQLKTLVAPTYTHYGDLMILEMDQVPVQQRVAELKAMVAHLEEKAKAAAEKRRQAAELAKKNKAIQKAAEARKKDEKLAKSLGMTYEELLERRNGTTTN